MTFLSSLGSGSTIASRISSSSSSILASEVFSSSRNSGSSPSASSSRAPAASSEACRHSSASLAAGPSPRDPRPPSARQLGASPQPPVLAADLRIAVAIADHLGIGHQAADLGEAGLDLLDEG